LQAFDRKVQLLREAAAKLTLAVQACSLHRHIADMSTLIQDLATSCDDPENVGIGGSVVRLVQALHESAVAESQCSVPLQDMLFQIDNLLKFDVARAVALIISLEEAREALLSAMSRSRVRITRPAADEGLRRLQVEECGAVLSLFFSLLQKRHAFADVYLRVKFSTIDCLNLLLPASPTCHSASTWCFQKPSAHTSK
jgi:hypothetical protein